MQEHFERIGDGSQRADTGLLRAGGAVATLLLMLVAKVPAQMRTASIEGVVRDTAGVALAKAKVTLKDENGNVILSAVTGNRGTYRIPAIHAGLFDVEAECGGYLSDTKTNVKADGESGLKLDFFLRRVLPAQNASSSPLGTVSFYEGPKFEPGRLKDPSAGGGYSDAASAQGNQMFKQYLIPGHTSRAPQPSPRAATAEAGANLDEEGFEKSGSALLAQRDFARAAPLFRRAARYYPQSARLQMGLGVSLYGQGKYQAAVEALCAAARLAPDDSSPDLLLSEALRFTRSPNPRASVLLERFASGHPRNAIGRYAYAADLYSHFDGDVQKLARAQSELESAVAIDPGFAAAHLQLGIVYDQENLASRAIGQYRDAIRLNPNLATAHYRLAHDDERAGAEKEAAAELAIYERLRKKGNQ